jgi:tripartite-type tricarboxylate transporter receptor subunit TctC
MKTLVTTVALSAGLVVAGAMGATAQSWPERPIQLIVPFPAGSATDTVARIIGPFMADRLGQPIVIENRPGASGAIGTQAVVDSAPDGYSIALVTTSTLAVAPALNPNLTYNPETDLAAIGMISISPYVLVTSRGVGATSVANLVEMARDTPFRLRYASAGPASLAHLAGALFADMAEVQLTHIPYRTSAQSVIDLAASRVDIQFGTIPPVLPHLQADSIDLLAVTGSSRLAMFPDTPTLQELGYEGYDVGLWMALVAPRATPDTVLDAINGALNAALADETIIGQLAAQGQEPLAGPRAALAERITTEIRTWRQVGERAGIAVGQ